MRLYKGEERMETKKTATRWKMSKLWDGELKQRIHELFPRQTQFSREKKKNEISTHFLRKVYGNYAYQSLADSNQITRSMWLANHLGWKPARRAP